MAKKPDPEQITLDYNLHDLPTAQHRAGLAGLILQIDSMGPDGNNRSRKLIPTIDEVSPTRAKINFTKDSLQGVFDDLYAAKLVDGKFTARKKKKRAGKMVEIPEDYIEESEVRGKKQKRYVYVNAQTFALANALTRFVPFEATVWVDLWRRMIWEIPRGGNNVNTRAPFNQKANKPDEPCGLGVKTWEDLVTSRKESAKSQFQRTGLTGALMLGAQSKNAELVAFHSRIDHAILLHFWQVVVMTFTPFIVSRKDQKTKRVGYVLTLPDVADLIQFRASFPKMLGNLKTDGRGRPDGAQIDVPEQASLEVLKALQGGDVDNAVGSSMLPASRTSLIGGLAVARDAAAQTALRDLHGCVRAVEAYHMAKSDKKIEILAFGRVADRPGLIPAYLDIANRLRNPLFRGARLRALVREQDWHARFLELFTEYPYPFFLEIEGKTPKYLPRFGRDAKAQFAAHYQEIHDVMLNEMDDDEKLKHLGILVRRIVGGYVDRRAAKKLGLDWDDLPTVGEGRERRKVLPAPEEFRKQQRRVCDDAFLQMRSRHDEDFVEFFAGSVCAVPHYFDGKSGDLAFLMQTLMTPAPRDPVVRPVRNRDDVKTLAMLALSAYSFNVRKRDPKKEGSPS